MYNYAKFSYIIHCYILDTRDIDWETLVEGRYMYNCGAIYQKMTDAGPCCFTHYLVKIVFHHNLFLVPWLSDAIHHIHLSNFRKAAYRYDSCEVSFYLAKRLQKLTLSMLCLGHWATQEVSSTECVQLLIKKTWQQSLEKIKYGEVTFKRKLISFAFLRLLNVTPITLISSAT